MRQLIYILALWAPILSAQCDVSISSWDAITGDIVIKLLIVKTVVVMNLLLQPLLVTIVLVLSLATMKLLVI